MTIAAKFSGALQEFGAEQFMSVLKILADNDELFSAHEFNEGQTKVLLFTDGSLFAAQWLESDQKKGAYKMIGMSDPYAFNALLEKGEEWGLAAEFSAIVENMDKEGIIPPAPPWPDEQEKSDD